MNRERAKELLPIIQAFAEGKTIQCRWFASHEQISNEWLDASAIGNVGALEYRIKPEPREWMMPIEANSDRMVTLKVEDGVKYEMIKVREVIE